MLSNFKIKPRTLLRGLATAAADPAANPNRVHGGLKDQDRIFQNVYGTYGHDLKSAQKMGDWYKTKEIILKGDKWIIDEMMVIYESARLGKKCWTKIFGG